MTASQAGPSRPDRAETSGLVFVDTHAHLDEPVFDRDRDEVLAQAAAAGVVHVLNIGYRPSRWATTAALIAAHPNVDAVIGLHPHHADELADGTLREIAGWVGQLGARAIGEIGLDYFREGPPPEIQRQAFAAQLRLARELDLPAVIHQRAAEDDLISVLANAPAGTRAILHSFDGTARLADFARDRGYHLGVGGLMTRAGSVALRAILAAAPLERLLLETDSPYLVPAGVKARRNSPAQIPVIAARLAALRGVTLREIADTTTRNAERAFNIVVDGSPRALKRSRA